MKWSVKQETVLIEEISKLPLIWDQKHRDYGKRSKKWIILQLIADKLNKYEPNSSGELITAIDVFRRWKHIRIYFMRLSSRRRSCNSEFETPQSYAWEHFQRLSFLEDVATSTNTNNVASTLNVSQRMHLSPEKVGVENMDVAIDISMLPNMDTINIAPDKMASSDRLQRPIDINGGEGSTPSVSCLSTFHPESLPSNEPLTEENNVDGKGNNLTVLTGLMLDAGTKLTSKNSEKVFCPFSNSIQMVLDEVFDKLKTTEQKMKAHLKIAAILADIASENSI